MIPSIETIVDDLAAGKITTSQAVGWLHQHAHDAGCCFRDDIAMHALIGLLASSASPNSNGPATCTWHDWAIQAYAAADAMLAARAPGGTP